MMTIIQDKEEYSISQFFCRQKYIIFISKDGKRKLNNYGIENQNYFYVQIPRKCSNSVTVTSILHRKTY